MRKIIVVLVLLATMPIRGENGKVFGIPLATPKKTILQKIDSHPDYQLQSKKGNKATVIYKNALIQLYFYQDSLAGIDGVMKSSDSPQDFHREFVKGMIRDQGNPDVISTLFAAWVSGSYIEAVQAGEMEGGLTLGRVYACIAPVCNLLKNPFPIRKKEFTNCRVRGTNEYLNCDKKEALKKLGVSP